MKKFSIEAVIYPHLPWPSFNRCMLPQIWINCESWSAFGTDSKDGERKVYITAASLSFVVQLRPQNYMK